VTTTGPAAGMQLDPDRNLALELVRATEAAAMASAHHVGRGDKNEVDRAAASAAASVTRTSSSARLRSGRPSPSPGWSRT